MWHCRKSASRESPFIQTAFCWFPRRTEPTRSGKETTKMMCATAGFLRDNAAWQLLDITNQLLPPHRPTQNHGTLIVNTNDIAAVLPNVDTRYGNLQGSAPFLSKERHHTRCSRKGGPSDNQQLLRTNNFLYQRFVVQLVIWKSFSRPDAGYYFYFLMYQFV